MNRAELKAKARESLGGKLFGKKWLMALLLTLVYILLLGASSCICGIGELILMGPLTIGYYSVLLYVSRSNADYDIGKMFTDGFSKDFGRAVLIGLLQTIFICLWSMLFVIPGIVKTYSYAMTEFIAVDHPEYGWKECIDESKKMMKGHKWELFVLDLSFIGWMIVSSVIAGIGYLWLSPYMCQTRAEYYRYLTGDSEVVVDTTAV